MGIMGQPDLVAILKLPSWKGRSSSSSVPLFLVPSGKIRIEIPLFTFFNGGENGFHALFDIFSVQEKAVKITHPGGEQRDRFHLFFGNIACQVRTQNIGEKNIKKTSVISYEQKPKFSLHVFVTDNGNICACILG